MKEKEEKEHDVIEKERLVYAVGEKQSSKVRFFDQIQIKNQSSSHHPGPCRACRTGAGPVRACLLFCPCLSPAPVINEEVEPL